jgi:hypothetical protein
MKTKEKLKLSILFGLIFVFYIYLALPSVVSWGPMNNYRNVSVRTTVNITDAMPEVLNITCNSGAAVTLTAGGTQNVTCLIQIRDYNGGNTLNGTVDSGSGVSGVNMSTFYHILNQSNEADDNNTHYTNSSCSLTGIPNGYYVNWTCAFNVLYYANNGTWTVNATVHDRYNNRSFNVSGYQNVTINALYALNVTDVIDFGQMFVGETSTSPVQANITNFGNMQINVSVYGYGSDNQTLYSNYALICEVRNLSLSTERYSISSADAWSAMTPITASSVQIINLTVDRRTNDNAEVRNATYWRLYVDPASNPFGQCNGTVVFSAVAIN